MKSSERQVRMEKKKSDAANVPKAKNGQKHQNHPDCYHDPLRLLKTYRDVRWNLKLSMEHHRQDFEAEYGMSVTEYPCTSKSQSCGKAFRPRNRARFNQCKHWLESNNPSKHPNRRRRSAPRRYSSQPGIPQCVPQVHAESATFRRRILSYGTGKTNAYN